MGNKEQKSYDRENAQKNILKEFFLERIQSHIILAQRESEPQRNNHKNRIHMKCDLTHHFTRKPREIKSPNSREKESKIKRSCKCKYSLGYTEFNICKLVRILMYSLMNVLDFHHIFI